MSDIEAGFRALNARLGDMYEADDPFFLRVSGRPNFWVDDAERTHKFGMFHRAPLVAGELAVAGFMGRKLRSGLIVPFAVGEIEKSTLPFLGFLVQDAAILNSAAEHAGVDYEFTH